MTREKKIILTLIATGIVLLAVVLSLMFGAVFDKKDDLKMKKNDPVNQSGSVSGSNKEDVVDQNDNDHSSALEVMVAGPSIESMELARKKIDEAAESVPQNIAEAYKTVDACESVSDREERDRCVAAWARYELDESLCDRIRVAGKEDCRDSVFSLKAMAEKNVSTCLKVINTGNRSSCIYRVIFESGADSIDCGVLSGEDEKNCRSFIENDYKESTYDF